MPSPDLLAYESVMAYIPPEFLCFECRKPLCRAYKGSCSHPMCQACFQKRSSSAAAFFFQCGTCHTEQRWEEDEKLSARVTEYVGELLVQEYAKKMTPVLPPPLQVALLYHSHRFLDPAGPSLNIGRLWEEVEALRAMNSAVADSLCSGKVDYTRAAACLAFNELATLDEKVQMQALSVSGRDWLRSVELVSNVYGGLTTLRLFRCSALRTLAGVDALTRLTHLLVVECDAVAGWALEWCLQLQHIEFSGCPQLTGVVLPRRRGNGALRVVLRVSDCPLFQRVVGTSESAMLSEFAAVNTSFADLRQLSRSASTLERADLRGCDRLTDLSPLALFTSLGWLNLTDAGTEDVPSACKRLIRLEGPSCVWVRK